MPQPRRPLTACQQALVAGNVALVGFVYQRVRMHPLLSRIDRDDALAAGHLGLCNAALHFDPTRGIRFATYAYYVVRREMLDAGSGGSTITVPNTYHSCKATEATRQRMAAAWKTTSLLAVRPCQRDEDERHDAFHGNPGGTMLAALAAPEDPDHVAPELLLWLEMALRRLDVRQAQVIRMILLEGRTLEQTGAALDPPVSRERVRQLREKGMARLKAAALARFGAAAARADAL